MKRRAWLGAFSVLAALTAALDARPLWAQKAVETVVLESVVLRPIVEAEISALLPGVLAKIAVDEGAVVKRGDLLAAVDDRAAAIACEQATLEAAQAEAQANNRLSIEYAAKALEVAKAELKRSQESNEKFPNSISKSQLDVERLTVEKLELELRQAQHERQIARYDFDLKQAAVEAAQLAFEQHTLRAPFDGRVALVRGRLGEWVQAGAPVLRLVAVDTLRAEGFAPADAVDSGLLGAAASFAPEGDDLQNVMGRINFVSPEVDPASRQVRVWALLANGRGRLRPGQQGRLTLWLGDAATAEDQRDTAASVDASP